MAFRPLNVAVIFNATAAGLADFVVASAFAGGFVTPEQASAIDGKVYEYYAQTADGLIWESGKGAYSYSTHTLVRTTIGCTSNGDTVKVNFPSAPIVCVIPSPSSTLEQGSFPSGTKMVFVQAAAPTGWTRSTTHNDKALRVVDGNSGVSSGGSNSFSSVMAQTTVGGTTPTISTTASHDHTYVAPNATQFGTYTTCCGAFNNALNRVSQNTGAQGGGVAHNHTILMSITYVDVIIAVKN